MAYVSVGGLLVACSSPAPPLKSPSLPGANTPAITVAPNRRQEEEFILVREWNTGYPDHKEFRDRNGDGYIDYQASGADRYSDGYGIYKEDNDFDRFYEREYEFGGYAGEKTYDRVIRERVPVIPPIFSPAKITRIPRPLAAPKP